MYVYIYIYIYIHIIYIYYIYNIYIYIYIYIYNGAVSSSLINALDTLLPWQGSLLESNVFVE